MRLTEKQAGWYRRLVLEELDAGADVDAAHRETYAYWQEYVRDDWRLWLAANERKTDDPLSSLVGAAASFAAIMAAIRNAGELRLVLTEQSAGVARLLEVLAE